ncbi:Eco57I restriction-modification methylase domain-containing protein [Tepidiforma thermophila]|uniref:site-specific DNA-methyltransferase (adenine-specific) n=1 Tax=Tepidiforma thermophila (strain KCTC 52669 / CGMCC 1.13589 / G233) TaxID=2761530 RepID=A0A2A9HIY0_TEPT2|nr:N-6 DNA methylase [Tepidiforma thermophila]PFG75151.1 N-6 DNA methylase [Tepidiforma thermophila]
MSNARNQLFSTIRTEGGILPPDLLARIAANDQSLGGLEPGDYHLSPGDRLGEAITRSWNRLVGTWRAFRDELERQQSQPGQGESFTTLTRERWLLPLFSELGYGRLPTSRAIEIDGRSYPVSHSWGPVPIHLLGWGVDLDRRTKGLAGAASQSPHGLVQELLNRSEERLYGFVSNGQALRLLRDSTSLTRQSYVEFDLAAMFDGDSYADFALLWLTCHQSRLEGEPPESCILERWRESAREQGVRALEALRQGVEHALQALGSGFLAHPSNTALREALRSGTLDRQDYYRQLLRLVYRLIFLFAAEDREVLFASDADPQARDRYTRFYSTQRLRRLSVRRVSPRHGDLWEGLKVVMRALDAHAGEPGLALPPLGSFLWSPRAIPHLEACSLSNDVLLRAVGHLARVSDGGTVRAVDYRNLGSEELGGVYESLLELRPELNIDQGTFELRVEAGHERKTSGSYYTPPQLVQALLDTALEPVLEERARASNPEAAILSLKVLDPASGSGHFLVAAAHRIARRLAAVRTGDPEPSPEAVRHALRDVVSHCIYAVDVNEMAVELCKVSLWLEALEPGRPLSFLDAHIRRGNSLIGVTPALLASGIPDEAYEPHALDDRETARALKKRNREERKRLQHGALQLTFDDALSSDVRELTEAARRLAEAPDDTPDQLAAKESAFHELIHGQAYQHARLVADAWCAAFFLPKQKGAEAITTDVLRRLARNPELVPAALRDQVQHLARELGFFHWHLEFPEVFRSVNGTSDNPEAGWSGGFDVILGNPPWEQVQLDDREFFASTRPDIAEAPSMAVRKRMLAKLSEEDHSLFKQYIGAIHYIQGLQSFVHSSDLFPLTSRGRINLAPLFAENVLRLCDAAGYAGLIVPTGIATDAFTQNFFAHIVERRQLASLYDFENRRKLFPAVDSRMKFAILTLTGQARPAAAAEFAFFCHDISDLADPERRFTLTPEDFRLLNPNTRTAPVFRTRRDAELTRHIYRRVPVLVDETRGDAGNPWGFKGLLMFMMNTDSGLFRTREQLEDAGFRLAGNLFVRGDERYLPLYEAKLVHQFDHRWATYNDSGATEDVPDAAKCDPGYTVLPRYWVHEREVESRLAGRWERGWLLGWRNITNATNERTVISAVIPRVAVGNNFPLALAAEDAAPLLSTILSAQVLDFVARQKVGGMNLNYFIFQQLPAITAELLANVCPWLDSYSIADWLRPRILELTYTAWDLAPFARDLGYHGPPFRYDPERRARLRAELDACFFRLYLGSEDEWQAQASPELRALFPAPRDAVSYILDQFPIVKRHDEERFGEYRTARLVLEAYDRMAAAEACRAPYTSLLDPPPADPSVAHPAPQPAS